MKKTCISLCLIVFAVLQAYAASSWKETRTVVFTPAGSEKTHLLKPLPSDNPESRRGNSCV